MILIGIGANLPAADGASPLETCRRAVLALDRLPGLRVVGLSNWYRTAPVGAPGELAPGQPPQANPDYVNAVAQLGGTADPAELLAALQAIEAGAGRQRTTPNAPRTLDLDIIAMGAAIRDAPDPILPHPRAHLRGFVLAPLVELAPGWVHPRIRRTAAALLAALPPQDVQRM